MSKSTDNRINGLKYILLGLTLMAVSEAAISAVVQFKNILPVFWADLGVHALAWLSVIFGMLKVRPVRVEFKRGFVIAIAGILFTAIQVFFVYRQYRAGFGSGAFIDMYSMFGEYMADVCMLIIFYLSVKAMAQLLAKNGETNKALASRKLMKWGFVIIIISMMIVPAAAVFPAIVKLILAFLAIAAGFVMKLAMIKYMNDAYKKLS